MTSLLLRKAVHGVASPACRKIICTDLFQVNIVSQFHVLGVNLEDLQSASGIRDADVHFPIKTPCMGGGSDTCSLVPIKQTHLNTI